MKDISARKASKVSLELLPSLPQLFSQRLNHRALYWVLPISLLLLWYLASNYQWMPSQILPTPQATWQSFWALSQQDLWLQLGISVQRFATGLLLGIVAGLGLGMLLGYHRAAEQYLSASFYALAIIPTLAWLPMLMVWLGIENALKIFIIFKATLVPMAIHTQAGVANIQPKLKEMAAILQFKRSSVVFKLILPAVLPYFFTGLRLALAAGWTSLIVVELLASSEGIGYLMVTGRQLFQLDIVFVSIFLIALVGIGLDAAVQYLERKLIFWPASALSAHSVRPKLTTYRLQPWLIPVLLVLLWYLCTAWGWLSALLLPSPLAVWQALYQGLIDQSLTAAMQQSLYRALLGLVIGGSLGLVVGLGVGLSKVLYQLLAPTLNTLRLIAIFAWIPLISAWFGLNDGAKIVFISLATFFPMFVATWKGVAQVPASLAENAKILQLNAWQRVQLLILPSITPAIFAGLRLALLYAWMASFGAEYLMGSGVGIGSYMMAAQQNFEMDRVLAATLLVAVLGAVLAWLGSRLEHYATAWRHTEG
jgi:sulfonate transport system permease protein